MNYLPKIIHQQYFFFLGNHPTASSSAIIIDTTFLPSHNKCIQICKHFNVIRGLISERERVTYKTILPFQHSFSLPPHKPSEHTSANLHFKHTIAPSVTVATSMQPQPTLVITQSWIKHEPGLHNTKTSPLTIKPSSNKQQREGEIEVRRDTRETRCYRWLTIILRSNTIFSLLCFDLFAFVPHSWSLLHTNTHQPLLWSDHVV